MEEPLCTIYDSSSSESWVNVKKITHSGKIKSKSSFEFSILFALQELEKICIKSRVFLFIYLDNNYPLIPEEVTNMANRRS